MPRPIAGSGLLRNRAPPALRTISGSCTPTAWACRRITPKPRSGTDAPPSRATPPLRAISGSCTATAWACRRITFGRICGPTLPCLASLPPRRNSERGRGETATSWRGFSPPKRSPAPSGWRGNGSRRPIRNHLLLRRARWRAATIRRPGWRRSSAPWRGSATIPAPPTACSARRPARPSAPSRPTPDCRRTGAFPNGWRAPSWPRSPLPRPNGNRRGGARTGVHRLRLPRQHGRPHPHQRTRRA